MTERERDSNDDGLNPPSDPLPIDDVLDLLVDRQRRELLLVLADAPDDTVTFDNLLSRMTTREEAESPERLDPDRLAVTLHHVHLHRLEEAGIVEYDSRSGTVRYRPDARLEDWIERIRSEEGS